MRIADYDLETVVLGPFQENCLRLMHVPSGASALIDPGMGDEAAVERLARGVDVILLTHAHLDHIVGIPAAKRASGAPLWIGRGDDEFLADPALNGTGRWPEWFGEQGVSYAGVGDRELADGEEFALGGGRLRVLFTPGHEPYHVAFALLGNEGAEGAGAAGAGGRAGREGVGAAGERPVVGVIAGDTLFAGSIGRTDLPGGDTATLLASIREKLLTLPDDVVVLPGHGPHTTIGAERRHNPFVGEQARD